MAKRAKLGVVLTARVAEALTDQQVLRLCRRARRRGGLPNSTPTSHVHDVVLWSLVLHAECVRLVAENNGLRDKLGRAEYKIGHARRLLALR